MLKHMEKLEHRLLTDAELADGLVELDGWGIEEGKLTKRFEFKNYKDGLVFALAIGHVADRLDHHPDLEVGYAKVKVAVSTHSVGGLSPFDLELARRIDALNP
jgi:4a-hydroxytetrahydrobiopterin dehydratase